jgi:hypothetical protein
MTAPAGWWCPTCGHTQAAPVADQPDPEPPMTTEPCGVTGAPRLPALICQRRAGHVGPHTWDAASAAVWDNESPSGVPVDDDTPAPTEWCPPGCGYCEAIDAVGDDTPTPTAGEWTLRRDGEGRPVFVHNGYEMGATDVVAAANRAEAAPDRTALPDAERVLAYLHEQHISLMWVIKQHSTKAAIDRVLTAVAALAREDTDDG